MKLYFKALLMALTFMNHTYGQTLQPPPIIHNFKKLTMYQELSDYLASLEKGGQPVVIKIIGTSVLKRNLYAVLLSDSEFAKDPSKVKVLIFAQQHGNEQSGKEAVLLLVADLLKPENRQLLRYMDIALIPQINPDGSEKNQRRNENGIDLNRNHLILTEPETVALHRFFDQYLFEVTLDVHEYSPYGESWKNFGYRKNADVTLGTLTNPCVSKRIRDYSNNNYLPWFLSSLSQRGFSAFPYCPGGLPEKEYIRYSTFDVNDGRQSLGIQNTLSFIQEGMNGKDDSVENLKHRAEAQLAGMQSLLRFVDKNNGRILKLMHRERATLNHIQPGDSIPVQCVHASNGTTLDMPLYSYLTGNDTIMKIRNFRPVVKPVTSVAKPLGYLIPKEDEELVAWVKRLEIKTESLEKYSTCRFERYKILELDSIDFEGDMVVNPVISSEFSNQKPEDAGYLLIPVDQLKGNQVCFALEPKSMLGLFTYQKFRYLLRAGSFYPVVRVISQ